MSEKKENREEEKEQSSSRSGLNDEQIEAALNACTFWKTKEVRCKDCPLDSDKEPCITNLHLAALAYIGRLKKRAEVAERALYNMAYGEWQREGARRAICEKYAPSTARDYLDRAEKELAEEEEKEWFVVAVVKK